MKSWVEWFHTNEETEQNYKNKQKVPTVLKVPLYSAIHFKGSFYKWHKALGHTNQFCKTYQRTKKWKNIKIIFQRKRFETKNANLFSFNTKLVSRAQVAVLYNTSDQRVKGRSPVRYDSVQLFLMPVRSRYCMGSDRVGVRKTYYHWNQLVCVEALKNENEISNLPIFCFVIFQQNRVSTIGHWAGEFR